MPSSTSGRTSSEPAGAIDAERLPPAYREQVYGRGLLLLWIGVLGGPLVWAADHQVAYWLVYHSCHTQSLGWLYVETVAAWAAAIACTFVGWRMVQAFPGASSSGGQADDRARFLGLLGVGMSGFSLLLLVASSIPRFILDPCP